MCSVSERKDEVAKWADRTSAPPLYNRRYVFSMMNNYDAFDDEPSVLVHLEVFLILSAGMRMIWLSRCKSIASAII